MTGATEIAAPAKLTLSLRVTGRRPDGYHLLDAEMVTVDLVDVLVFAAGEGITVVDEIVGGTVGNLTGGPDNLVARALGLVGRRAAVRVVKRIPVGAGLGGGSADAAAVLRWAGRDDPLAAVGLGSDVPFCVRGGRARVTGGGEEVRPLRYERRCFVLLLPPLSVSTAEVYRAYDDGASAAPARGDNDLEEAALVVAPRLAVWRDLLTRVCGQRPRLAGSGSTWFVEGRPQDLGLEERTALELDGQRAPLRAVGTLPPDLA